MLPERKAWVEYDLEREVRNRIKKLSMANTAYLTQHIILNNMICKPKFKETDLQPLEKLSKCRTMKATIDHLCPNCFMAERIRPEIADDLSNYFLTLQTPR